MERIDRPPVSESQNDRQYDHQHDANGGETASHWLSSAMAMWIQQDEAQTRADREGGHADTNTR